MANSSEKRRAKEAEDTNERYWKIILAVTTVHVIARLVWGWRSASIWTVLGFLFLTSVNAFCLKAITTSLRQGLGYESYQDAIFINWAVEVLTCISSYFWYLYLVIPGYAIVKYGPSIWRFLIPNSSDSDAQIQETLEEKKKREKKERKAERSKVKYLKR